MKYSLLFSLIFLSLNTFAQKKLTVSGYITDEKSSETLIGATVFDQNSKHGAITNVFGFYSLTLPEGTCSLKFSYVGYTPQTLDFFLSKDTLVNIRLSEEAALEEIVVTAQKDDAGITSTKMGSLDVPVKIIEHTPAILGETDVMKTIQLMPGVQQGTAGSSAIYVRGGGGDENLILLDGAPVYKIDHCFGFFSVFTPEAVKKVTFYKSSFPARYNGRVSSVIDVRTKDGDMQKFQKSFSIGLLSSRFTIEGPIKKDKTSFSVSGRTTYLSLLTVPIMSIMKIDGEKINGGYWFYDFNAKVNHKFSDKDRLYVSFYRGVDKFWIRDKYEWNDTEDKSTDNDKYFLRWGNLISTVRWNHVFSPRLFSNTTFSFNKYKMAVGNVYECTRKGSSYDYNFETGENKSVKYTSSEYYESEYNSSIIDLGLSDDFDFMPNEKHDIKFGFNYINHNFDPETAHTRYKTSYNQDKSDTLIRRPGAKNIYANELSLYAEDDWKIANSLHLNPGFAYTLFAVGNKTYSNFQPRFSVKYSPLKSFAVKASYTRMSQCVHLLSSTPISLPTDLWVPITENIKPETAEQYSVGLYYTGFMMWEFSLEGYYKELDNVLEYKDGMSFMGFSSNWQDLVAMGKGKSKGLELLVKKVSGKATGWISYTLSKSDRDFDAHSGVNNGDPFPFTYDRRHNIGIVYNQKFSDRIDLDATWTYYSGSHATVSTSRETVILPENKYEFYYNYDYQNHRDASYYIPRNTSRTEYVENRNNYTLPATHLLCIGINIHKQKKRCERIFNISVYNAYNAKNPNFCFSTVADDGTGEKTVLRKITFLPLIPSVTWTYKF
ncbi:MAG: TonB-dependent receptor [Bacteroidales bacterium]|nr:TonB-dependent receptor [Bacteroidales bacterium]